MFERPRKVYKMCQVSKILPLVSSPPELSTSLLLKVSLLKEIQEDEAPSTASSTPHPSPPSTPRRMSSIKSSSSFDKKNPEVSSSVMDVVSDSLSPKSQLSIGIPRAQRQVHFGEVELRRYPMIMGDSPCCRMGAPVSLGWEYEEVPTMTVDDFETIRIPRRRRKLYQLILSMYQREAILERMGVDPKDIKEREREMSRIQSQRQRTAILAPFSKVEEVVASAGRKLTRAVHNRHLARHTDKNQQQRKA